VIVCEDNLTLVVLGALVEVVACSTERWNAYTEAKVEKFRLNDRAEAWALIAHPKVEVTVLTAGCANLARRRDAKPLITVATAPAQGCQMKLVMCNMNGSGEMTNVKRTHIITSFDTR
jgi:hypothetical protein